jgi:hypothetical protein
MMDNRYGSLDFEMQQQFFGNEVTLRRQGPTGYQTIHGGVGQTMDQQEAHFSGVLDGIASAIREYLRRNGVGIEDSEYPTHVTLMPDEGSPWEYGERATPYYNAKTRRIEETQKPEWLTEVEVRDPNSGDYIKATGADFCKISPTIHAEPGGPVMIRDSGKNIDFMMTHGFDFFRPGVGWREIAKFFNRCSGLLFPSIAVGQVPATTIGTTIFVLDAHVVLQGLRPYRTGRGQWPIVVYASDAWTETTRTFLSEAAHDAFLQLTGQWNPSIYGTPHFYILGPRIGSQWMDIPGADQIIPDTKKLLSILGARARKWHREADGNDIGELQNEITVDRYPYLEAKANGIVAVDALALCVVPSKFSKPTMSLLQNIGFQGEVLTLRVTAAEAEALRSGTDYEYLYQYSWRVHDAVAEYAASTGRIEHIRF